MGQLFVHDRENVSWTVRREKVSNAPHEAGTFGVVGEHYERSCNAAA